MEKRSQASFDSEGDAESSTTLLGEQLIIRSRSRSRPATIALKLFLGVVATASLISLLYTAFTVHKISQAAEVDYGDCGSNDSVEEARAKGCIFDPMGWIWVRPECYDAEMVTDFLNRTDFSWHTEPKLTPESRVPMDVIFRGDHPKLFTQKKYHYVHCTYMWKKMHKAILEHRPIDSYLTEWHHTNHCEKVLLSDFLHEDVQCTAEMVCPTWVRATWTACKRY